MLSKKVKLGLRYAEAITSGLELLKNHPELINEHFKIVIHDMTLVVKRKAPVLEAFLSENKIDDDVYLRHMALKKYLEAEVKRVTVMPRIDTVNPNYKGYPVSVESLRRGAMNVITHHAAVPLHADYKNEVDKILRATNKVEICSSYSGTATYKAMLEYVNVLIQEKFSSYEDARENILDICLSMYRCYSYFAADLDRVDLANEYPLIRDEDDE